MRCVYRKIRLADGDLAVYQVPAVPLRYKTSKSIMRDGVLRAIRSKDDVWMVKHAKGCAVAGVAAIAVYDNLPLVEG